MVWLWVVDVVEITKNLANIFNTYPHENFSRIEIKLASIPIDFITKNFGKHLTENNTWLIKQKTFESNTSIEVPGDKAREILLNVLDYAQRFTKNYIINMVITDKTLYIGVYNSEGISILSFEMRLIR